MKHQNEHIVSFAIPAGHTATYIPEKSSFENPKFGFEIWYEKSGNNIVYHKKISIKTLEILPQDFAAWNEMVKKLNKAYKESITLKKAN
jgi:hypothetical protein